MSNAVFKGLNVLIVDDDEDLRSVLIFDFQRRGCVTFEAANGSEAFAIVQKQVIDLVLSDIRMPNGTGVDLLKEIRARNPNTPIVLLASGYSDFSEPEILKMGASALLDKPIDRQKMIDLIEKELAGRPASP